MLRNAITLAAVGVALYAVWKLQQERKDCVAAMEDLQSENDKLKARKTIGQRAKEVKPMSAVEQAELDLWVQQNYPHLNKRKAA